MIKVLALIVDNEVKSVIMNSKFNRENHPEFEEIQDDDQRLIDFNNKMLDA